MKNETLFGSDDGLLMNEDVGSWSEEKYAQFRNYAQIFTTGMSKRWDSLIRTIRASPNKFRDFGPDSACQAPHNPQIAKTPVNTSDFSPKSVA